MSNYLCFALEKLSFFTQCHILDHLSLVFLLFRTSVSFLKNHSFIFKANKSLWSTNPLSTSKLWEKALKCPWFSNYWLSFKLLFYCFPYFLFITDTSETLLSQHPSLLVFRERQHDMKIHSSHHIQSLLLGEYIALLRTLPCELFNFISTYGRKAEIGLTYPPRITLVCGSCLTTTWVFLCRCQIWSLELT